MTEQGVFKTVDDPEGAEGYANSDEHSELLELFGNDTILTRIELANRLRLSPNRVSELVRMGVIQPVCLDPLFFSLEWSRACYNDYRW